MKGVAKLGYAWEANHVVVWRNEADLATALRFLTLEQAGCLTDTVLVQQWAPNDCEFRVYIVNGQVRHTIYSAWEGTDHHGLFRGLVEKHRSECVSDWFKGDEAAFAAAEAQIETLIARWLLWVRTRDCDYAPPPIDCAAISVDVSAATFQGQAQPDRVAADSSFSSSPWMLAGASLSGEADGTPQTQTSVTTFVASSSHWRD